MPNGGLRFDQVVLQGNRLLRHTTEDVAIVEDRIDRAHRAHVEFARSRALIPFRWVMQERVTVESLGDETSVTVRVRGRPVGLSRVLHLLGYRDTMIARHLEGEAARRTDFRARGVAAHFTGPRNTAFWSIAGIFAGGAVIGGVLLRRGPLGQKRTPSPASGAVTMTQAGASPGRVR